MMVLGLVGSNPGRVSVAEHQRYAESTRQESTLESKQTQKDKAMNKIIQNTRT